MAYDHTLYKFVKHVSSHVTPPIILCVVVDSTPYHHWGAMVTIQRLNACIYWFLPCLQCTRARPSLWNCVKRDSSLKAQCLHPVPEVPPSLCSSPQMAASPVIQSQSRTPGRAPRPIANSQKPICHTLNRQSPQKPTDHLHAQTSSWDETIVYDHSD